MCKAIPASIPKTQITARIIGDQNPVAVKSSANVGNAYNEVKTDGKFCSECGTTLSMTAKFCPECGTTQE